MLKLISINIEYYKHFDRFIPFLEKESPDVLAIQEILEDDLVRVSEKTGMTLAGFSPMALRSSAINDLNDKKWGVALFSRFPILSTGEIVYVGDPKMIPIFSKAENDLEEPNTCNLALRWMEVAHKGNKYTFVTTHFTWTPLGISTPYQLEHLQKLFNALDTLEAQEIILCGDFNAPRGLETWNKISAKYKDNIPLQYKTSIDVSLHRVGKTKADELADKMVDGLFTTPTYKATDVRLVEGVSDHMAIVATIEKA